MKTNEAISSLIKKNFTKKINSLSKKYNKKGNTVIYVTVDKTSGEVMLYDSYENTLADIIIFDWIDKADNLSDETVIAVLQDAIKMMVQDDAFKPFISTKAIPISYVDDNMNTLAELFVLDPIRQNDDDDDDFSFEFDQSNDLMKKLDREFDEFLEKLLKI